MDLRASVAANLRIVKNRIAAAIDHSRKNVRVIAVSKKFSVSHVEAAAAAGLQDLGENRVQEAVQKQLATNSLQASWHLIGHLQSNKARMAAEAFDWIHSVDSVDLLRRLDRVAACHGKSPNLLIQINLAGESTKHGAPESEVQRIFDAAISCKAIKIRGLMVLPPWSENPEDARPYFRRLRQLRDELRAAGPDRSNLDQLSMGMSHDLEVAVEEGATMIRVGTALFGPRPKTTQTPD